MLHLTLTTEGHKYGSGLFSVVAKPKENISTLLYG